MTSGDWLNQDGLNLQYGTQKAFPENGGDFLAYGDTREMEVWVPLATLSTSATALFPVSMTTFFPGSTDGAIYIEEVDVFTEAPTTGSASATLSVGLGYLSPTTTAYNTFSVTENGTTWSLSYPQITAISTTAFVSALPVASLTTQGTLTKLTAGVSSAGGIVGGTSVSNTVNMYVTAGASTATFSSGAARIRIRYRGAGTISY